MGDISKLILNDLKNETFFNALKGGEFCLVLGAGFSYGLKNKTQSEFDDEKFIPIVTDFISLTKRKFNTSFKDNEYQKAADKWKEKIASSEENFSSFKNLFLVDEVAFENSKQLYANILAPNWANIYTFNFDNVLDSLIKNRKDEFDVQYYYVGKFSPDHKRNIGYLHNSILQSNKVDDLVFTIDTYSDKIEKSDNHLYFSIFNDVEYYKKNILIIGSSFDEQSLYNFLLTRTTRDAIKIIHINYSKENKEPYFTSTFREKVKDISWINCTAVDFLNFISDNLEKVSKQDFLPKFLEQLQQPQKTTVDENSPAQSFNDFLSSQYLKYYSRENFKHNLKDEIKKDFLSEKDFLKFITEENYYGLIIHGQGGIGKTRLMLELGKGLLPKEFIVIKVLPDFENFDELVEYFNLRSNKKYLLLFDYIEEQKVFEKTINWIISTKISNIRVIGNCRNTFVSDIQNNFSEHFKFIDIGFKNKIGLEKKLEQDYKREVILSIINSISDNKLSAQLKNDNVLKSFYQARPSFAAFIKYIHLKNPQTDLSIATNDTFSNWLIKKLKLTAVSKISYSEFFEKKKHIFQILSCLPANPDAANKLEKIAEGELSFANEITKLINDGWIDEKNQSLKVVHDTVNDTLLLEFFKHFQFRNFYLTDFLEFALRTDSISSMLWSIQRIWDDFPDDVTPSLQKSIAKFIDNIFNENIVKENWFKYKLDNTHLISEQDRIDLIIKHRNLLKENFALEKFGSSLAFSIEWVYENIADVATKKIYSDELCDLFFNEWNQRGRFNDFVKDARGGKIISSYINLFGIDEYIKDRFNKYLGLIECNIKNLEPISLAIVSWFKKNGEVNQKTKDLITLWFNIYKEEQPEDVNPTYLINCCLSRRLEGLIKYNLIKPNIYNLKLSGNYLAIALRREESFNSEIKTFILNWFEVFEKEKPENINPATLALAWLEKGDDSSIIRNVIQQILIHPYRSIETKARCISLWLEKSNDVVLVEPFIDEILAAEIFYKTAYYIIGHWLEKSDNTLLVKPFLSKWLNNKSEPQICSFIFQNWLSKGDDPNIIIEPIKKWLSTANANSIGNVFSQFIYSNGNISELRKEIIEWLSNNSNNSQSVSVLGFLLEKTNDETLLIELEISAEKVFKNFSTQREIGFSIGYWIEKGGQLSIVEPYINGWLKIFGNSEQGSAIIRNWLERNGNCSEVKEFVIPCLNIAGKKKEASTLMLNWTRHGDDPYLIKDFIKPFFEIKENQEYNPSKYLIITWLGRTNEPLLVRDSIKSWLAANGDDAAGSIHVCSFWINKGNEIGLLNDYILHQFKNHSILKQSYIVLNFWLKKGGNPEILKYSLINYLKNNWEEIQAIDILKILIKLNIYKDEIKEYILNISHRLGYNPFESLQLSMSIKSYLKSGQSPELIKNDVIAFLGKNGLEIFASHVIAAWIQYGNDFGLIKDFLITWLDNNLLEEFDSSFVIAAALENESSFNVIHDKTIEWLNKFGKSAFAKFPLSSWLKLKGKEGAKEIEAWIIYWVENLYDPKNHNWRDDLLLNLCNEK